MFSIYDVCHDHEIVQQVGLDQHVRVSDPFQGQIGQASLWFKMFPQKQVSENAINVHADSKWSFQGVNMYIHNKGEDNNKKKKNHIRT